MEFAWLIQNEGSAGPVFRFQDLFNYYAFSISFNKVQLLRFQLGKQTIIKEVPIDLT